MYNTQMYLVFENLLETSVFNVFLSYKCFYIMLEIGTVFTFLFIFSFLRPFEFLWVLTILYNAMTNLLELKSQHTFLIISWR